MSASKEACFYTFVYTAVVLLLTWPVYIYLLTKWYAHRNHFAIRNRWPLISLIIITISFGTQTLTAFESAFCISTLNPVSVALSNAVQGLVYYRTYLLYAQTIKTRQYLHQNAIMLNDHKECSRSRTIARIILCTISIASMLIIPCRYLDIPAFVFSAFTVTLFIGIFCLLHIICARVKDSIGITKECIAQMVITFLMLVGVACATSFAPSISYEIVTWMGVIANVSYGFSTLFIPYNLIRKADVVPYSKSPLPSRSPIPTATIASESAVELHQSTGLNIPKHPDPMNNASVSGLPTLPLRDPQSLSQWLHKPLWLFLKDNMKNHTLFIGYLGECFAVENMLFLERSIILHHLIKKFQNMDTTYALTTAVCNEDRIKYEAAFSQPCYKLQFAQLNPIYNDIGAIIKNDCDESDPMMYKRGILKAMALIYRQFCHRDSDTEINIAFGIHNRLCALFEDQTDAVRLEHLTNYDDLLMVYHDAILQCWNLCVSIYGFQFKSYLRENMVKEEKELSLALVEHDSAQKPKMEKIVVETSNPDFGN
eukprot:990452_1